MECPRTPTKPGGAELLNRYIERLTIFLALPILDNLTAQKLQFIYWKGDKSWIAKFLVKISERTADARRPYIDKGLDEEIERIKNVMGLPRFFTTSSSTISSFSKTSFDGELFTSTTSIASAKASNDAFPLSSPKFNTMGQLATTKKLLGSPSSKYFRIRDILSNGLTSRQLPRAYESLPFQLQFEIWRIMRTYEITCEELEEELPFKPTVESLRGLDSEKGSIHQHAYVRDTEQVTYCAKFHWSHSRNSILDLELLPPKREKSHSIQRKFGASRCLVVHLPTGLPPHELPMNETKKVILDMLATPQKLLGRNWRLLHCPDKNEDQVLLFAVSGCDIEPVSLSEVINFSIPIRPNALQPSCKAFARLDLAISRTTPTFVFPLEKILYGVDDRLATESDENGNRAVMSDGCCEISSAAMNEIRKVLEIDHTPSVVQARIFGSKGVWYKTPTADSDASDDSYIKIAKSQIKAKRNIALSHDVINRTLNVNAWSRPAKSSVLYPAFCSILVDRGVPKKTILKIAREQVQLSGEELLTALKDPKQLLSWIHRTHDMLAERTAGGISKTSGFPNSNVERIIQMLEAGFRPQHCQRLASSIISLADKYFESEGKKFKIKPPCSTTLIGIADPTQTLEPDEVVVNFSTPFQDPQTGSLRSLNGKYVLVGRNPAMRNSDIRKLRVVSKPQLDHLDDVIIFSSRGQQAVADQMSNGDYDGDLYWICFDKSLTAPFSNTVAPRGLPPIEDYFITKDERKVQDFITIPLDHENFDEEEVQSWILRNVKRRQKTDVLGVVSLYHAAYIYHTGNISSPKAEILANLHDHLVDRDKQGYSFDWDAWARFRKEHNLPQGWPVPAHSHYTRRDGKSKDVDLENLKYKKTDIIDMLFFEAVQPEIDKIKAATRMELKDALLRDDDLFETHNQYNKEVSPVIVEELKHLKQALKPVKQHWAEHMGQYVNKDKGSKYWHDTVEKCRAIYLAIQPQNPEHDIVKEWLRPKGSKGSHLTTWEEIRASTLARFYYNSGDGKFMFGIAGAELCALKSQSLDAIRYVGESFYLQMKPQKPKTNICRENYDEDELDDAGSEVFDGESVLDEFEDRDHMENDISSALSTPSFNKTALCKDTPKSKRKLPWMDESPSPSFKRIKTIQLADDNKRQNANTTSGSKRNSRRPDQRSSRGS